MPVTPLLPYINSMPFETQAIFSRIFSLRSPALPMSNYRSQEDGRRPEKHLDVDLRVEDVSSKLPQSRVLPYSGEDALPLPPVLTPEEEKRLWRKIDWHIVPIITIMYLCSFVDRSNIGTSPFRFVFFRSLT